MASFISYIRIQFSIKTLGSTSSSLDKTKALSYISEEISIEVWSMGKKQKSTSVRDRFHRTLINILSIERIDNRTFYKVIIPSWNPSQPVFLLKSKVPVKVNNIICKQLYSR